MSWNLISLLIEGRFTSVGLLDPYLLFEVWVLPCWNRSLLAVALPSLLFDFYLFCFDFSFRADYFSWEMKDASMLLLSVSTVVIRGPGGQNANWLGFEIIEKPVGLVLWYPEVERIIVSLDRTAALLWCEVLLFLIFTFLDAWCYCCFFFSSFGECISAFSSIWWITDAFSGSETVRYLFWVNWFLVSIFLFSFESETTIRSSSWISLVWEWG